MTLRSTGFVLIATALIAGQAVAQDRDRPPPDEPLSRIPGQRYAWIGTPRFNDEGLWEVWSWVIVRRETAEPDSFALLVEIDCEARGARRLRREAYVGDRQVQVSQEDGVLRAWGSQFLEHQLTGIVCWRHPTGETAANRAEALMRTPRD